VELLLDFFADSPKMYARITNYVDITLDLPVYRADLSPLQISITKYNSVHIDRQQLFSVDLKK